MNRPVSLPLNIAYCLVIFGAVVPIGLTNLSWVRLATGSPAVTLLPFVGLLVYLLLGGYRIFLVCRGPSTLGAPPASGVLAVFRAIGIVLLFIGAVISVLNVAAGPLMYAFMPQRTGSGVEYFAVGLYLAFLPPVGVIGLILFEFSRLLAFERAPWRAVPSHSMGRTPISTPVSTAQIKR